MTGALGLISLDVALKCSLLFLELFDSPRCFKISEKIYQKGEYELNKYPTKNKINYRTFGINGPKFGILRKKSSL